MEEKCLDLKEFVPIKDIDVVSLYDKNTFCKIIFYRYTKNNEIYIDIREIVEKYFDIKCDACRIMKICKNNIVIDIPNHYKRIYKKVFTTPYSGVEYISQLRGHKKESKSNKKNLNDFKLRVSKAITDNYKEIENKSSEENVKMGTNVNDINNEKYNELKESYEKLIQEMNSLKSSYDELETEYLKVLESQPKNTLNSFSKINADINKVYSKSELEQMFNMNIEKIKQLLAMFGYGHFDPETNMFKVNTFETEEAGKDIGIFNCFKTERFKRIFVEWLYYLFSRHGLNIALEI